MVGLLIVGLIFIILQILFSNYVLGALYELYSKTSKGRIQRLKSESKYISFRMHKISLKKDKLFKKIHGLEKRFSKLERKYDRLCDAMIERDDEIIELQKD